MAVCGISGRGRHSAAAIAADGRILAAVEQAPLTRRATGRSQDERIPMEAIDACLTAIGLTFDDVTQFVFADGYAPSVQRIESGSIDGLGGRSIAGFRISRLGSFARLAQARGAVVTLAADGPCAAIFADGEATELPRANELLALTCRLASELALDHDDSAGAIAALEQLAASAQPGGDEWFGELAMAGNNASTNAAAFDKALQRAAVEAGAALSDVATPLVRRARVVADVANAFLSVLASHLGEVIRSTDADVMLAGTAFNSPDFVSRVQRAAGCACLVAPCASIHGAALGAALVCGSIGPHSVPDDLAIGPVSSEADAKTTPENCRLDYIYEPRWPRLLERVSRLLERGKIVAWFQGRAEFGYPFRGSRSFLCDPSSRYARDNINVFLLQRALSTAIPLALADTVQDAVEGPSCPQSVITRMSIEQEWRERLRAGVDAQGYAHAYVAPSGSGPLADLLKVHFERTGVPGLANLPLSAADDVAAISARDAVRAAFASSADALVIHRFVVMKDYWQLHDDSL